MLRAVSYDEGTRSCVRFSNGTIYRYHDADRQW